jgi:hypothetical protein
MPVAGGGYLRLYPHQVTERFIAHQNLRGLPAMVYLHPWELDAEQTRRNLGMMESFQHYVNLDTTEWKLNRLLQRFAFGPVSETLKLPRLQAMLRRNPVTVPEQSPDFGHKARTPFPHPVEVAPATVVAETLPAPEAAPLSTVTWPLHIGPTVDWTPIRRMENAHASGHGSPGREAMGPGNPSEGETMLSEDLETATREAY